MNSCPKCGLTFAKYKKMRKPRGWKTHISLCGMKKTAQHIENIVKARKEGAGYSHTAETKRKISAAGRGRKIPQQVRNNMSKAKMGERNPNYGKPMLPQVAKALREATRRKPRPGPPYWKIERGWLYAFNLPKGGVKFGMTSDLGQRKRDYRSRGYKAWLSPREFEEFDWKVEVNKPYALEQSVLKELGCYPRERTELPLSDVISTAEVVINRFCGARTSSS